MYRNPSDPPGDPEHPQQRSDLLSGSTNSKAAHPGSPLEFFLFCHTHLHGAYYSTSGKTLRPDAGGRSSRSHPHLSTVIPSFPAQHCHPDSGLLTIAALTLNVSYFYSIATGNSNLQLTLFHKPTITAHRGLSAKAPENTLYAFSDAIDAGADMIELDVQQTKDGVLVVLHDQDLQRTTGMNRNIWDVTYDEIRDLDAGSWFDPAYANARIPTLEETLQFIDGRIRLNIEIKPTDHTSPTLEQDVADLITKYGYTDNCWVTSFSYSSLKRIKETNPDIRTGYIMSVAYGQFYSLKYADAFSLNKVFVTSQVVNSAHQAGKQVFAWTVNSVSEVRSLCNLHVDSIITDDPIMVQDVVSRTSTSETIRTVMDYLIN